MVTVVSTTAATAAAALGGDVFSIATIVALVVMLVVREMGSAQVVGQRRHLRLRFLVLALNAPILSLLAVFVVVVAVKVWEIL